MAAGLESCTKGSDGRCDKCRAAGVSCDYLKELCVITDKESEQRKALEDLDKEQRNASP